MIDLNNTCLVVAHPDSEISFFGSVVGKVKHVIISYLLDQEQKRKLRLEITKKYPLSTIEFLPLNEANVCDQIDINKEFIYTTFGIQLKDKMSRYKYYHNAMFLKHMYNHALAGYSTIITHSPWGTVPNAEHIQVYKIVKEFQSKYHYDIWYPNYVQTNSVEKIRYRMEEKNLKATERIELDIDLDLCVKIKRLYQEYNVWTMGDYNWNQKKDIFYRDLNPFIKSEKLMSIRYKKVF